MTSPCSFVMGVGAWAVPGPSHVRARPLADSHDSSRTVGQGRAPAAKTLQKSNGETLQVHRNRDSGGSSSATVTVTVRERYRRASWWQRAAPPQRMVLSAR